MSNRASTEVSTAAVSQPDSQLPLANRQRAAVIAAVSVVAVLTAALTFSLVGSSDQVVVSPEAASAPMGAPSEPPREPRSVYASPDGIPSNDGSRERPLDLATALGATSPVAGGDTLWLRSGVYSGAFVSGVSGRPDAIVHVKAFPGERVVLDGAGLRASTLTVSGADVWFWDLEITNSNSQREFAEPGEADNRRAIGVRVLAPRTRYINVVVHDALTGFSIGKDAADTELYGCVLFKNGIRDPRGGFGHGLYAEPASGVMRVTDLVTFDNQARGVNISGDPQTASSFVFDGLASFDNGQPSAENTTYKLENLYVSGAADLTVTDSHLYHSLEATGVNVSLGAERERAGRLTMTGNTVVGGSTAIRLVGWRETHVADNLAYVQTAQRVESDQTIMSLNGPAGATRTYSWQGNRYTDRTERAYPFVFNAVTNAFGGGNLSFAEWRAAVAFERDAQYSREPPVGVDSHVRRHKYDPRRWHVVIHNWELRDWVEIDFAAEGLQPGDSFELRDVRALAEPAIHSGTYTGAPITVSLSSRPFAVYVLKTLTSTTETK